MNGREKCTERRAYSAACLDIKQPLFQQVFESVRVRAAVFRDEDMLLLVVMVKSRRSGNCVMGKDRIHDFESPGFEALVRNQSLR